MRNRPVTNLRLMTESDLSMVLHWRNHASIRSNMYNQKEISFEEHSNWFKRVSIDPKRRILILDVDTSAMGYVSFCCDENGSAIWGFYTSPDSPKGTGKMLGKASIAYAFQELILDTICGEVLQSNLASQNFHLRLGFVFDSCFIKDVDGGKKYNIHRYLLTRDRWSQQRGVAK